MFGSPISQSMFSSGDLEPTSPMPSKLQLEGCLYRRRADKSTISNKSNTWTYHNHVIQGPYLRYIRRPLNYNSKEAAAYRLILVAGKSRGRLQQILISPESEIYSAMLNENEAPSSCCFVVNVSGTTSEGQTETWQLAMQTASLQAEWVSALMNARSCLDMLEESGEAERLRLLARKMMCGVDVRSRYRIFNVHAKCFLGKVAVKWLMAEMNCSSSQAVNIGNRMLNAGLFHHVAFEHVFCDRKLYYRFSRLLTDPVAALHASTYEGRISREDERDQQNSNDDDDDGVEIEENEDDDNDKISKSYIVGNSRTLRKEKQPGQLGKGSKASNREFKTWRESHHWSSREIEQLKGLVVDLQENNSEFVRLLSSQISHIRFLNWMCFGLLFFLVLVVLVFPVLISISGHLSLLPSFVLFTCGHLISQNESYLNTFVSWSPQSAVVASVIISFTVCYGSYLALFYPNYPPSKSFYEESFKKKDGFSPFNDRVRLKISDALSVLAESGRSPKRTRQSHRLASSGQQICVNVDEDDDEEEEEVEVGVDDEEPTDVQLLIQEEEEEEEAEGNDTDEEKAGVASKRNSSTDALHLVTSAINSSTPLQSLSISVPNAGDSSFSPATDSTFGRNLNMLSGASPMFSGQCKVGVPMRLTPRISVPVPPASAWPNRPILLRRNPGMLPMSIQEGSAPAKKLQSPIKIHANPEHTTEIPIESDFFIGKMFLIVADIPGGPDSYFSQYKRRSRVVLQGRFKRPIQFSSVYTGQVFDEPIASLPARWLVKSILHVVSRLQPGVQMSMRGDKPFFLSPMVSAAQSIVISRIGSEPKVSVLSKVEEDLALLGRKYDGMSSKRRKAHFSRRCNLEKHYFDPNLSYTFDFYQHMVNLSTFQLDLGFMRYDLLKFLGARPLQIMAVAWDPLSDFRVVQSEAYNNNNGSGAEESHFDDETAQGGYRSEVISKLQSKKRLAKSNGGRKVPPIEWPYIYNLEIWHERSIALDSQSSLKGKGAKLEGQKTGRKEREGVSGLFSNFFRKKSSA